MIGSTRVLAFGGGKPILEEYTTARVRSRAKIASWNDFASRRILPLEIVARDTRTFEASLRIGHLGSIAFFETSSLPAMVDHRMEHIASIRERWFGLAMVLQGTVDHSHYGRQITLVPGDFVLQDSHTPLQMWFSEPCTLLALRLTPEHLARHIPAPEDHCGIRVPGDGGFGRVLRAMLPELWIQVQQGVDSDVGSSIANQVVALIGSCYATRGVITKDSAARSAHKAQIRRLVETHLAESSFRVSDIAVILRMSPRYVHKIFERDGESISAYIMRRRLEECARELRDPRNQHRAVNEIAFDWGFGSAAHFSRSFRTLYRVSPTEFRRKAGSSIKD